MEGTGEIFRKETRQWFAREIGQPTRVQEEAWPFIAAGRHTLVSAPTGTGKTLAAFLVFLDRLMGQASSITWENFSICPSIALFSSGCL